MPPPYVRHVFVCINERPFGNPKGDCLSKGAADVVDALKREVAARGLKSEIRVNKAGCLDSCERGVSMVVYPEGVWYGGVTVGDVLELVDSHLVEGRPVERLRLSFEAPR